MRAVAALMLSATLFGCFNNPRHQTYAKIGEGVAIVGGIALLTTVNTGADCEEGIGGAMPDSDCQDRASLMSNIGLGLILVGLVGFIVTVSTSEEDDDTTTTTTTPTPTRTPTSDTPAGPAAPAPPPAAPAPVTEPATPAPTTP